MPLALALACITAITVAQTGWTVLNIPPSLRYDDIHFINADTGWAAGGADGWIRRTVNGGGSWTLQYTSPYYLRSIEFMNADTGFAGSLYGQLYRTTDGGQSWTDIATNMSPAPQGICGLAAVGTNTLYACGLWAGPAYIYRSTNAGNTWSHIDMSAHASRLVDIFFLSPDTGFVTGTAEPAEQGGVILYTTDGGASWTTVHTTNALTDIVWKIQRLDAQHWFGSIYSEPVNDDTRMLRSTDGGMSWEQITVDDTYTYVEAVGFIDALHGWTGGEDRLWETIDGGTTWEEIPLGYAYNRFFKVNDSTAYLSGRRIYKYREEISTGVAAAGPAIDMHELLVHPNPAEGHITIDLRLDRNTIADLRIVAANGSTVEQVLRNNNALKGEYAFGADLNGRAGSVYFVVLKSNEGMLYRKVVLGRR